VYVAPERTSKLADCAVIARLRSQYSADTLIVFEFRVAAGSSIGSTSVMRPAVRITRTCVGP
jgi:hypothetical protein